MKNKLAKLIFEIENKREQVESIEMSESVLDELNNHTIYSDGTLKNSKLNKGYVGMIWGIKIKINNELGNRIKLTGYNGTKVEGDISTTWT